MKADDLAAQVGQQAKVDHRAWARKILERFYAGDKTVSPIAVKKAKEAIEPQHWRRYETERSESQFDPL